MKRFRFLISCFSLLVILAACQQNENQDNSPEFKVDYEKFTLDNGLQVILHIDK